MKIAPMLQSWTFDDGKWSTEWGMAAGDAQTRAQRELRALLAVARAAKRAENFRRKDHPKWTDDMFGISRALARLDKVSTGRAGKGDAK